MSCPSQNLPLRERLRTLDDDVQLPTSFYVLSLLMVATVFSIPMIYRWTWLFVYDLVSGVRSDLKQPEPPAGCRRIGKAGIRNLSNEFPPSPAAEKDGGAELDALGNGKVEALFIHPIKSTAPIELDSATVTPLGLAHDRLFSFAQQTTSLPDMETNKITSKWIFLTQRSHARLDLVKTELWLPDPNSSDYDEESEWTKAGGCVVVRFPFTKDIDRNREGLRALLGLLISRFRARSLSAEPIVEFRLPLNPSVERAKAKGYRLEKMKIWREEPEAWNIESEVPTEKLAQLKFHLGLSNPLTIFRVRDGDERVLYKCAPGEEKNGYQAKVAFQDSYPIHIQNLSTISDLESRIPATSKFIPDSRRFRANLYISGPTAYMENNVTRMTIRKPAQSNFQANSSKNTEASGNTTEESDALLFSVASRTPRCTMPNIDPSSAERSKTNEPLKTMNSYLLIDQGTKSPCLGMHAVALGTAVGKTIRVGDEVVLDGTGEHLYNKDPNEEAWTEIW